MKLQTASPAGAAIKHLLPARDVLLAILRAAGGEWTGTTTLHMAFYYAHLHYSRNNLGLLTDQPILRTSQGPGIEQGDALIADMIRDDLLTKELVEDRCPSEYRYRLTDCGSSLGDLPEAARMAVEAAAGFCREKTSAELLVFLQRDSRTWREGADGDQLDLYVDLVPDEEYEQHTADILELERQLFRDQNS